MSTTDHIFGTGYFPEKLLWVPGSFWNLRRGPRYFFHTECCTGGDSMGAPRVSRFLAPTHPRRARGWTEPNYRFSSLPYNLTANRIQATRFRGACSINYITYETKVAQLFRCFRLHYVFFYKSRPPVSSTSFYSLQCFCFAFTR